MKRVGQSVVALLLCIQLSACANMTNQDAGVLTGAIAGGVLGSTIGKGSGQVLAIAAGTLAGAVIGGQIGRSMDQTDRLRMNQALESNPVGRPAYWQNANSGANYQVVPTRNVSVGNQEYCREYRTTADIGGKKQHMYGTACRQPDGSWQAVN